MEIEAEDYDGQSGATKQDSGDAGRGQSISAGSGGWVYFEVVDFSDAGAGAVQLRVNAQANTTLDLRADTQTGPMVGTCAIAATAGAWQTQSCTLTRTTGVHKLYVNFGGTARLNWIKFQPSASTTGTGGTSGTGAGGTTGAAGATGAGGGTGGRVAGAGGSVGTGSGGTTGGGGTSGAAGTTGSGPGVAGTTGPGTGAAGDTGSGTGTAGTTGPGTGAAGDTGSGTGTAGSTGPGTGAAGSVGVTPGGGSSGCACDVGDARGRAGTVSIFGLAMAVLRLRRKRARRHS
jgi:hypothetical protein